MFPYSSYLWNSCYWNTKSIPDQPVLSLLPIEGDSPIHQSRAADSSSSQSVDRRVAHWFKLPVTRSLGDPDGDFWISVGWQEEVKLSLILLVCLVGEVREVKWALVGSQSLRGGQVDKSNVVVFIPIYLTNWRAAEKNDLHTHTNTDALAHTRAGTHCSVSILRQIHSWSYYIVGRPAHTRWISLLAHTQHPWKWNWYWTKLQ